MINLTPVSTYHSIPIYLKSLNQNKEMWLKWVYQDMQYGVRVSTLVESTHKAKQMIDAMLELEAIGAIA